MRLRAESGERVLVLGAGEALRPYLEEPSAARWETVWRKCLPSGLRLLLFAEAVLRADSPAQHSMGRWLVSRCDLWQ